MSRMSRRGFISDVGIVSAGLLTPLSGCFTTRLSGDSTIEDGAVYDKEKPYLPQEKAAIDPVPRKIYYSHAVESPELRQIYLDSAIEAERKRFPYMDKLRYGTPQSAIDDVILRFKTENPSFNIKKTVDTEYLKDSYSTVFWIKENIGNGEKSDVYIFPQLFDELTKVESNLCFRHEDTHCEDVCNGIIINKYTVDHHNLDSEVLDIIMELRASHSVMEDIQVIKRMDIRDIVENLSNKYEFSRKEEYGLNYKFIRHLLEEGDFTVYENDVMHDHLLEFDTWIKPEYRYRG